MNLEQEKMEIKETIQLFFDGFDNFDAELITKAFYSDKAEMFSIKESSKKLNRSPVKNWSKIFEKVKNQQDDIWNIEKSEKISFILI